ncbi:MAG: methyltransferase domain-containing protein [Lentisphaerae bacterium]|nr:methyltransferase domain-containing protein [Lentisphaerota bacterium]
MSTLNLEHYAGSDLYSDGAIEDELLAIVRRTRDFTEIVARDNRWPVLYHLSPDRRNLLEWFPFRKSSVLLEIGAGCGALTGLLTERCGRVVAVELSRKRGEIVQARYPETPNLEIRVGNIMDLPFSETFDTVTLIGVLEYARSFVAGANPGDSFLRRVAELLRPRGELLIAVENKFGLKYFAGAQEEHTGRAFDGIEGYCFNDKVETFSKTELTALLRRNGFASVRYYYPYPDYKFPDFIFSETLLPEAEAALPASPKRDVDGYKLFDERLALPGIIRGGWFDVFANGYLAVATREPDA